MVDPIEQEVIDNSVYDGFVGVKFFSTPRAYFFGFKDMELSLDDKVIVETTRGVELGVIAIAPISIDKYSSGLGLKPIIRKATDVDIKMFEINEKDAFADTKIYLNVKYPNGQEEKLVVITIRANTSKIYKAWSDLTA